MFTGKKIYSILLILCSVLFVLGGCATTNIKVDDYKNIAPKFKFSDFSKFELNEVTMSPEYSAHSANIKARNKIQEHLDMKLGSVIYEWNQINNPSTKGTLAISPEIIQIKFIGGAARFWAGALTGSSAVNMNVVFTDKETGNVIDKPSFYQHANAMGGAWSIGGTDNSMLQRIADLIVNYTVNNYKEAIGGPTGKPVK